MNRRDRRAQERRDRSRRTITVPDGKLIRADVLTPQGVQEVTNYRKIPAKQVGVHRWICAVSHYFTPEQADSFANRIEASPVLLDASNLMSASVGCIDCEGEYHQVVGQPCTAGDEWQ